MAIFIELEGPWMYATWHKFDCPGRRKEEAANGGTLIVGEAMSYRCAGHGRAGHASVGMRACAHTMLCSCASLCACANA